MQNIATPDAKSGYAQHSMYVCAYPDLLIATKADFSNFFAENPCFSHFFSKFVAKENKGVPLQFGRLRSYPDDLMRIIPT